MNWHINGKMNLLLTYKQKEVVLLRDIKAEFGLNLYNARKSKKMTQIDLAAAIDVTRTTISKYETGVGNPRLNKIIELAEVLEIHPEKLFQTD